MASKALVAASTRPLILAILSHGESYGYRIIREVERLSGGKLEWTEAMLYPVLHRLDKEGLIRSQWTLSPEGRRRKYYAITEAGASELALVRREWLDINSLLDRLCSRELSPSMA